MSLCEVFSFTDLTLLFYRVYFYFILELRTNIKQPKTNLTVHILNYNSSFSLDTDSLIVYIVYTSFKLNIVNSWKALAHGPPVNPGIKGLCFVNTNQFLDPRNQKLVKLQFLTNRFFKNITLK